MSEFENNLELFKSKTDEKTNRDNDKLLWYVILFLIFIIAYAYFAFVYFK
jgi:flagellar basal body-associated protein FliL